MIPRARIVRAAAAGPAATALVDGDRLTPAREQGLAARERGLVRGRLLRASVDRARAEAADVLAAARAQAEAILDEAKQTASEMRRLACEEAKQEAAAALSVAWIRLRHEEATKDERELERTIGLARALAERLLGEALEVDPDKILALARQVLAIARHARTICVVAHPQDADVLARRIAKLGLESTALQIQVAADRPRGSLLLRTDLGIIDADIALQLDRLTRALLDDSRH
jgi:type III secretion protein L